MSFKTDGGGGGDKERTDGYRKCGKEKKAKKPGTPAATGSKIGDDGDKADVDEEEREDETEGAEGEDRGVDGDDENEDEDEDAEREKLELEAALELENGQFFCCFFSKYLKPPHQEFCEYMAYRP